MNSKPVTIQKLLGLESFNALLFGKLNELTQKNYFKSNDKYTFFCACIISKTEENDLLQRLNI